MNFTLNLDMIVLNLNIVSFPAPMELITTITFNVYYISKLYLTD